MKKFALIGVSVAAAVVFLSVGTPADAGVFAKQKTCFTVMDYNKPIIKSRFVDGTFLTYTWGYETSSYCIEYMI